MKLVISWLLVVGSVLFISPLFSQPVFASPTLSQGLAPGTSVNLTDYFLPIPGEVAHISSGETFFIRTGQNGEFIQCTNDNCSNFQKIFPTADGFGIQGENHWNSVPNTTFQYRQGTFQWDDPSINLEQYPQATWLPSNMRVGDTHDSGPITVIGFIISPDPNEVSSQRCDSTCNNTGAGNGGVLTKLNYVGTIDFGNNIQIDDVAVVEVVSGPGTGEKFYFAKDIGWVGWEYNGASNIINQPLDGAPPVIDPTPPPGCPAYTCRYSENIAPEDALQCSTNVRWVNGTGCDGDNCEGCQYSSECSVIECFVPEPISTPTPIPNKLTPTPIKAGPEEEAVYNLKRSLLPKGIEDTPKEQSLWDRITQYLDFSNLVSILVNPRLATATHFYSQSESLNQSAVVKQVVEKKEDTFVDNLKNFLGGPVGFYGVSAPKIEGAVDNIKDSEEIYEKSYFPNEIKPITGQ